MESKQGFDARMSRSFDVLHPGGEQVVMAFEVEVFVKTGMPGPICRVVSTEVY